MVSPKNPISAILGMMSRSTDSSRSHRVRCGIASRSRKSRARARNARCSSLRVRSMGLLLAGDCGWGKVDECGERGTVRLGRPEEERIGLGALEVQVGGVLPGHAEAAVQLNGLLRGMHRHLAAEGGRH